MLQLFRAQLHLCFSLSVFPSVCKIEHTGNFLFPYLSPFPFLLSNATSPGLAVHFFPIKWYCFPNSQISWREPLFQIFGKSWDFVPTIKEGEGWSTIPTSCKNLPKNYVPEFRYWRISIHPWGRPFKIIWRIFPIKWGGDGTPQFHYLFLPNGYILVHNPYF